MKFQEKEISDMTDSELRSAKSCLDDIYNYMMEKRNDPRFQKRMENQPPPTINPTFEQLKSEIDSEINKRKLENV